MALFLFIIPFFVFAVGFFSGNRLGAVPYVAYMFVNYFVLLFISGFLFFSFFSESGSSIQLVLTNYFAYPSTWLYYDFTFAFDFISVTMSTLVVFITFLVMVYTVGYMEDDPYRLQYLSYLSFFCFAMIFLVVAGGFLTLYFGWELVGFASFLLISFKTTSFNSGKSALLAVISNKIGDITLMFAMILFYYFFSTIDYYSLFLLAPSFSSLNISFLGFEFGLIDFICFFVAIACFAKSAQAIFFVWLINSMCSPTPTSSLLHSSTMVLAGVYLFIRIAPVLDYAPFTKLFIMYVGAASMVFGSIFSLFQMDIKKIIAFSTMSQIGFMLIAVSVSLYSFAFFHLVCHGFVKNLMFLVAGFLIHSLSGIQDLRYYGSLGKLFPLASSALLVSSLSLMGFPFTTVFYSKDAILDVLYFRFDDFSYLFVFFFSILGVVLTTLYCSKLVYYLFFAPQNTPRIVLDNIHYPSVLMYIPLFVLSFLSIFAGYFLKDIFLGFSTFEFSSLFGEVNVALTNFVPEFYIPYSFKIFVYFIIALSQAFLFRFYSSSHFFIFRDSFLFNLFRTFFGWIYFQNSFMTSTIVSFFKTFFYYFDRKLLDPFAYFPSLISRSSLFFRYFVQPFSSNFFYYHIAVVFFTFTFCFFLLVCLL